METEDWTWLKHNETGGLWKAPTAVVADVAKQGWAPTDERPVEPNPATAEMPREWFEQEAPTPAPKPARKSTKDTSTEGSETVG